MTKDTWLNDRIITAAQKLICKALGKIDSFQSVLNSQKRFTNYLFRAVNNERTVFRHAIAWKIRWLVTLRSLNALYRNFKDTSSGKLTLSFLPVQKKRRWLQLLHIRHCICRRDSRRKVSHWFTIWCSSSKKLSNFMLSGKRSATFSKSKARWCINILT